MAQRETKKRRPGGLLGCFDGGQACMVPVSAVAAYRYARLAPAMALFAALVGWGQCAAADATDEGAGRRERISFNRQIRPILSENCFLCHGPDEAARESDLRLDQRQAALDYGALVPGDLDASLLIQRIGSVDPDLVMPPPKSHKSLTGDQKRILSDWIGQGARYEQHWAFEPIAAFASDQTLDDFVAAKLRGQNLQPSPPAARERWLRRVSFDLTGLPPTVAEIDAFLSDESTEARELVVDRLLASPAYGERMATEWLDVARYSDTYGYQVDRDRFVWPWRDWVIGAFNQNLPYDEFLTQQLAGDLQAGATEQQILATTFNRLHPQKVEGGSVEEEFRVEYVVDRTQTAATAFLGLTFECARCHDHKFDPLTQKEFYELNAFFANINEAGLYSFHTASIPTPALPLPTSEQRTELAAAEQVVTTAELELERATEAVRGNPLSQFDATALALDPVAVKSFDEPTASALGVDLVDGVVGQAARLSGDRGVGVGPASFRRWEPFSIALWMQTPDVKDRAVIFHRSLGWTDAASRGYQLLIEQGRLSAALVHYWPGNAINVRMSEPIPTGRWLHVTMTYDGSSRAAGLQLYIDGEPAELEIVQDALHKEIVAGESTDVTLGERSRDRGFTDGLVDEIEVFDRQLTTAEIRARARLLPLNAIFTGDRLTALSRSEIDEILAQHVDADCRQAREKLQAARAHRDQLLDGVQEIMVMQELPELRPTFVLGRGAYDAPQERVGPGTPAALPPLGDGAPRNRLGLAEWLTRPDHPLTSRVAVNRYWQLMFGRGLVLTTEDFGSQGSPPTHPELLDWLSRRFIDSGWDLQQLLKTIALSETYQRDSAGVGGSELKDPENLWLARGPAVPLSAEMIRDAALATSGLLSRKIGGAPVKPYELAASFKPVQHDQGEGLYRRSLYTYWKRTAPAPVMLILDASTRDVCRVRRERTSSPLQAMVLLNGPQYVEAAIGAGARVLEELGENAPLDQRLTQLFRRLTSRTPNQRELSVLERLYADQHRVFAADESLVASYLAVGEFQEPEGIDSVDVATMAIVAQAVMNLDDCLIKR